MNVKIKQRKKKEVKLPVEKHIRLSNLEWECIIKESELNGTNYSKVIRELVDKYIVAKHQQK